MGGEATTADARLDAVIQAIPSWRASGKLAASPMEGGITNHNYLVEVDGERFVARLAGRDTELLGIDREAEFEAATAAHRVGIAPEVVWFLPKLGCLVTRFIEAVPIPPDRMARPDMMRKVTAALRAFHGGPPIPAAFSPFRVVRVYRDEAVARGVPIPPAYDGLLHTAAEIEAAFDRAPVAPRPCHNDLLNANFLLQGGRLFLVDYEYAGMGDPFFDLGNFSVNHGFGDAEDDALVAAYFGRPSEEAMARLKLMRVMSDFREAMWGVLQQGISTLDFDYVDYADKHFTRCLAAVGEARFRAWLDHAVAWAPAAP
jgi:thiamine kinase-like enzyme